MLPRAQRLTTGQFDRAFAKSQSVRHPLLTLRAHSRNDGENITRAAFVVPKKVAKLASERNRIRRRVRERFRLHPLRNSDLLTGCDLIFMATPQTRSAPVVEIDAAIEEVLRRMNRKIGGERAPIKAAKEIPAPTKEAKPFLPLTFLALLLIRFYQRFISPGLPPSCRFEPSCSRYTYASIERFGLARGGILGLFRVCKCHPWHAGGLDPVPHQFPIFRSENQNRKNSWPLFWIEKSKK